jgi:hypothetical protein
MSVVAVHKSFLEWLTTDTAGIIVLSAIGGFSIQTFFIGVRNAVVNKVLSNQGDVVFNQFTSNIEDNINVNKNKANQNILSTQYNGSKYFDPIPDPNLFYTFIALIFQISFGIFLMFIIYVAMLKLNLVGFKNEPVDSTKSRWAID